MRRLAALVVSVAVAAVLAGVARAEPAAHARSEAARRLTLGNRLYQEGRYAEAIDELKAGLALDPLPDFLYALGQAERKRGDCRAAVGYYQRFLETGPSSQRAVAVLVQIDRCKQEQAATTAPVAPPPPEPPPAAPVASPPVAAPTTTAPSVTPAPTAPSVTLSATATWSPQKRTPVYRPLWRRWWLWTAIVGVAAAGVGVGLGVGLSQKSFSSTLPDLVAGK
jgi:hypothetical protein